MITISLLKQFILTKTNNQVYKPLFTTHRSSTVKQLKFKNFQPKEISFRLKRLDIIGTSEGRWYLT